MALADFTFDTDIASAATLPSTWYRDPLVLTVEQDRVFARTWQLVGHSEQVRIPGDYFTSLYRRNLADGAQPEALYYWVFPNLMLNLYPDNLQTNIILPLGPDRTLTRFEWYVLEPNSPGVAEEFARSFAFSDQVQQEDIAICEAVQKGLCSRTYDRGRYSVLRENGVHHFHGLLTQALR
jgi:phenylpropionate dioxygenase-like ring-hydroxylating dioxygenase large terminal subunit